MPRPKGLPKTGGRIGASKNLATRHAEAAIEIISQCGLFSDRSFDHSVALSKMMREDPNGFMRIALVIQDEHQRFGRSLLNKRLRSREAMTIEEVRQFAFSFVLVHHVLAFESSMGDALEYAMEQSEREIPRVVPRPNLKLL